MAEYTHICNTDCYVKVGDRAFKRYYEGQFYSFGPKEKVPKYFDSIKRPKEEVSESKALAKLEKKLADLKKAKNPSEPQIRQMEELEEKIAVIKGEQAPDEKE